jgi:hypothetical protein
MKVVITTNKELTNPHLELDINLDAGVSYILLKYTCPNCAGYGCHNRQGGCDNTIKLLPEDVLSTLGAEAKPVLEKLFQTILNGKF